MNTEQLYSAMLNVQPPAQADILHEVGQQYGYNDRLAGLRQQASEIQKKMLGDQSALFSATNPDGSAVDPRVLVAQYQQSLTSGAERLNQIQKVQDVYSAEMQTLAGAMADQYKAKAQSTQSAIQFMQQLNQEKNADRSFGLQKDQFEFQKDQFEYQKDQAEKPEWVQDTNGNWVNKASTINPWTSLQDFTSSLKRNTSGSFNNVWQDANNPGNIMADTQGQKEIALKLWASGFYKSPNWRTYAVFPSMGSGMQAMMSDLKTKIAWGSSWVRPTTTLAEFASGWVSWPNAQQNTNAVNAYVKVTGYNQNTRIADIPLDKLAKAIVQHEWVDISKNANIWIASQYNPQNDPNLVEVLDNKFFDKTTGKSISGEEAQTMYGKPTVQWKKEYTETQKNLMYGMDAKNISSVDQKILTQNGLKAEDVYNYKAKLKEGKWSQWLDDTEYKRVNQIIDDLDADQVTKTFKKTQEAFDFASRASIGDNATDNQALIYAFAKAMDPDSVVREGEYATVQKYSQTWKEKFSMDVNRAMNGQEFISEDAKKNIVNAIKSKYGASKGEYESLRNTKIKKINDISGRNIGEIAIPSDVREISSQPQNKNTTTLGEIAIPSDVREISSQPQNKNTTTPGLPPPKWGTLISKW